MPRTRSETSSAAVLVNSGSGAFTTGANSAGIGKGVTVVILSGGTANSGTILSWGTLILDSGGVIGVGVNVSSGGTVELIGVNLNLAGAEFNFSTNAIIELGRAPGPQWRIG